MMEIINWLSKRIEPYVKKFSDWLLKLSGGPLE